MMTPYAAAKKTHQSSTTLRPQALLLFRVFRPVRHKGSTVSSMNIIRRSSSPSKNVPQQGINSRKRNYSRALLRLNVRLLLLLHSTVQQQYHSRVSGSSIVQYSAECPLWQRDLSRHRAARQGNKKHTADSIEAVQLYNRVVVQYYCCTPHTFPNSLIS